MFILPEKRSPGRAMGRESEALGLKSALRVWASHLKKMGVLNKCLAYHPAILQPKRDKIGQSDLETVCPSTSFRIVIKDSLLNSVLSQPSHCVCVFLFLIGTSRRTRQFGTFPGNYVKPLYL